MFLTERKLEARIQELAAFRYRDAITLPAFLCTEDAGEIGAYPPPQTGSQTMKIGDRWHGRDLYLWLTTIVGIPVEWCGKKVLGLFDFGRTGGGNNSGFESLLFVNDQPYQGVDSNHQEVFFSEEHIGSQAKLDFRLWSGLEGGGEPREQYYMLKTAKLCWLDEQLDDFYFTSLAIYQSIKEMEASQPEKQMLTTTLNEAYQLVDWSIPGSEEFYESCMVAQSYLREKLEVMEKNHPVTIHCIGHTHIDVAWLWRLKHTREKAARSFSTVLQLMKQYPDYYFLQTQPQLYEYIKQDYPEIFEKMKAQIQDGKWEPDGAMWLEADCNIPSGESLVRQILYGKAFFQKEFAKDCKYLWLPDVFGYSWALPQILKKSGIETFMTTKISWNQYNRMPHDTFFWRGIDGSEILTHFITTPEPWNPEDSWFYTYNGLITARTVTGAWKSYRNKEVNQDLLLSYGYGDGGGGVNREMLELRRHLDEVPGIPKVKTSTAGEFFNILQERVKNTREYVHRWDGELYLEYHRGTYTSQAYNKRMNRKLELAYREAEWLNVWSSLGQWERYPKEQLDAGWKIILRNQFHDIIPGSSIHEVYEDSKLEYAEAEKIGTECAIQALENIMEDSSTSYTVYHSSQWEDENIVFIPEDDDNGQSGFWTDTNGAKLISQKAETGWLVFLPNVPQFGMLEIRFVKAKEEDSFKNNPFAVRENAISTPFYEISWNEDAQLQRIFDKEAKREVLSGDQNGNVFTVYEDKPLAHDAWDIDIFYQEKYEIVKKVISREVIECGTLRTVIRTKWNYRQSVIEQDMILYAQNKRIDFTTKVDWHEKRKLLKVQFPVDIRAVEATYDIQFGNVKRPTHWNTSWDMARFESVGHQWADLSEADYGVSLLNDCKYGYDIKDNVLRLSLLKAATYPDPTADQGTHLFTYSLYPHRGDWREGNTVKEAWYVNNPLQAVKGKPKTDISSFMQVYAHNHIHVDSVKKAENEDGIIIRIHEYKGKRGDVQIDFPFAWKEWSETNLMEEAVTGPQNGVLNFTIKPYEIKTFLITFE